MLRVVAIADTHGMHDQPVIPDGDILIHAGDLTPRGTLRDVAVFDRFLATLPHRHKIVIAGNHDLCFEAHSQRARELLTRATYLEDEATTVAGLHIWGSPWQPWFYDWAFNLPRGQALREKWDLIPDQTDILITHGPPFGRLDLTMAGEHAGCRELWLALQRVRPMLHIFGHIHEGAGVIEEGPTTLVNASICTATYQPINHAVVIDVATHPPG
jgi:Icc-related predicted phosphoesterase